ncbi:DUF6177 family protein [Georgenia phoenicis]|uniref:DUF6177 family protein n=1 Tax=unclassified Georgenia TaxID=2626815 RepID=UPI0039AF7570
MSVPHPGQDGYAAGALVSETRAEVAYLSELRADLVSRAATEGHRVILVSDEVTRLTYPMRQLLLDTGGGWAVRGIDGTLRDGLTGRRLSRVSEVLDATPIRAQEDVAVRYLRPAPAQAVQLVVSQSVRHKAADTTLLGGTAEILSQELLGAAPAGWGPYEPALRRWDRGALTELVRGRAPQDTALVLSGDATHPLSGTLQLHRTAEGLEETTQLLLGVGAPGSDATRRALEALPGAFATLAAHHMPLFGLVMARTGRRDLTLDSLLSAPPTALGMLIGPPGVRELGLAVTDLAERFDARVVGRPRIPGLYFPLGGLGEPGWDRLDAVVAHLGRDRVQGIVDIAGTWMESTRAR